eukprot:365636-Chlamydomonas_euryale.AAC.10
MVVEGKQVGGRRGVHWVSSVDAYGRGGKRGGRAEGRRSEVARCLYRHAGCACAEAGRVRARACGSAQAAGRQAAETGRSPSRTFPTQQWVLHIVHRTRHRRHMRARLQEAFGARHAGRRRASPVGWTCAQRCPIHVHPTCQT